MQGGTLGQDVAQINPNVKVGIIPTPAIHPGDDPIWIGGERYTLAAWKDSPQLEEAKEFIAFMAWRMPNKWLKPHRFLQG